MALRDLAGEMAEKYYKAKLYRNGEYYQGVGSLCDRNDVIKLCHDMLEMFKCDKIVFKMKDLRVVIKDKRYL